MNSTSKQRRWVLAQCDEQKAIILQAQIGGSAAIARLLVNRGVTDAAQAARFLNPTLDILHDPELLPDVDLAVKRVAKAIQHGEKIFVFGDYDVDGVTSTALLVRTLIALGADVLWRLPRRREGYDIKPCHVSEAAGAGAGLLITCDCGSSAFAAASAARQMGIDVVVTDHHEPPKEVPGFLALVNPKRRSSAYPFRELAGVGVALKFAQSLVRHIGHDDTRYLQRFLDLAAIGTVGDVVPLLDENRALVKHGISLLPDTQKMGIRSLVRQAGLAGKSLTAESLAYAIGPRINAAGRVGDPNKALNLLLTKDEKEADMLAGELEMCNAQRKADQEAVLGEAVAMAESRDLAVKRVLVLVGDGWKPGVLGLLAGRISEMFCRPAIVLSRDTTTGMCSGSARSIDGFDIRAALSKCSGLLERFGGHSQAAGLSLHQQQVEAFDEELNEIAAREISDEQLIPRIEYEAELDAPEISLDLAEAVASMEPFGSGNPKPLFVTRDQQIKALQRVGDGSHLKLDVSQDGGPTLSCVAFGLAQEWDWLGQGARIDLCYNLRPNEYNGKKTPQLVLRDVRPAGE